MGKTISAKELKAGDRFKYHRFSRNEYVFVKSTVRFIDKINEYALCIETDAGEHVNKLRASVWLL